VTVKNLRIFLDERQEYLRSDQIYFNLKNSTKQLKGTGKEGEMFKKGGFS